MKLQLFGKDKYIHFGVCLAIAYVARVVFGWMSVPVIVAALIGFCCAMCTGIGKEYGDKLAPGNKWDWYDIGGRYRNMLLTKITNEDTFEHN